MGAAAVRSSRAPGSARGSNLLRYAGLLLLTLVFLSPLIWMVLTAFKTEEESAAVPPTFLPSQWSTESIDTIFTPSGQTPVTIGNAPIDRRYRCSGEPVIWRSWTFTT